MATAITAAIYLYLALFTPGTLVLARFTLQDDARQFMAWMPRLVDPVALPGDPLADYWHAVSPWLYRLPFELWAAAGLDPILLGRLIPALLIGACGWLGWRVGRAMTDSPRAAFIATGFLLAFLLHEDSIYSATPRAVSPVLLLAMIDSIFARRDAVAVAILAVLAGIYPSTALLALGLLGMSFVELHPRLRLRPDRRFFIVMGIATAVTVAAAYPLTLQSKDWGPALTLKEAMTLPNLAMPGARSTLVNEAGNLGWVCSSRMGFLPEIAPCGRGVPLAWLANLIFLAPLLWLAARAARGRQAAGAHDRLYYDALVVSVILFSAAALLAFALHLPSRYSQRILGPLEWLATGQMIGGWIDRRLAHRPGAWPKAAAAIVGLLLAISFVTPTPGLRRPADEALMRSVAALPAASRIAAIGDEAAMIPAATGRAILASSEHAIPWHNRYRHMIERNLAASLLLISTPDRARFARVRTQFGVTHLLVERTTLESGAIDARLKTILPAETRRAAALLTAHRSWLQQRAQACSIARSAQAMLIDAACVADRSR